MFYYCPKCKQTWQYPIEKCPECFSELKKEESQMLKVSGVSKTNIPTILHPKVPYFILLLEDEKGRKFVQKSEKEYKIGDEFKIEKAKNKSAVAIWRMKYNLEDTLTKLIGLIGEIKLNSETKVLILPTLAFPAHPYLRENTSPEFLKAVISYLFQKGIKPQNIKVAGQSFDEIPIEGSVQKSGLLSVFQELKVSPFNLAEGNFIKKNKFEISEELSKNDLILNLPLMKADATLKVKGALFNLLKLLKKENYLSLKYLSSDEEILQELRNNLPTSNTSPARNAASTAGWRSDAGWPEILTIAESYKVQRKDKINTFLGIYLASFNPLNLDRVFAEIIMSELPDYLKSIGIEEIEIVGRQIKEVQQPLQE